METRVLGGSGIEVGPIGLGCMGMSHGYDVGTADEAESIAVIHRALEIGVTLLDTADVYGPYTNEELVGRALAGRRDRAVVATKCGLVHDPSFRYERNGSPDHVRAACDDSLRRLGVDHIDLYQLHRVDPSTPLEETWSAFAGLVAAGKVRAIGLSEVRVEQLEACHAIHPVASVQSELSLWTRDWAEDVLPWCTAHGVAFLPYSPLGRGFLTGALGTREFGPDDFRAGLPRFAPEAMAENQAIVDAVAVVAARHDATAAQVALAWLLAQGPGVVPIPGTKRLARLEENAAAARLTLSADDLAELDALPAPSGGRY
ncbi:MAG: aldo/keto reductase [Actinomycetales bacterium]|nr:aldo/keto reductase [Actinomycetales bacterium]